MASKGRRIAAALAIAAVALTGASSDASAASNKICVYRWTLFRGYVHAWAELDEHGNADLGVRPTQWTKGKCPENSSSILVEWDETFDAEIKLEPIVLSAA